MKRKTITIIAGIVAAVNCFPGKAQDNNGGGSAGIVINADLGKEKISRHIYGQFSEHLGHGIYGGIWVGTDSPIPNTDGIRNDVVEALRKISIPNLRWPGGCFADEYHWKEGIGPRDQRPEMVNTHWGGVTEDNSFGTHEFLELCEQLGAEPYICGNVGSGTVEEMSDWVEYINFDGISPMADERRVNGRDNSWGVSYWGVGNENWGCGGHMQPEYYADLFRRYGTYCRNYGDNHLRKIACGSSGNNFKWTEVMMRDIPLSMMWGLSLHHYLTSWGDKGSATGFGEADYFKTMTYAMQFDELLDGHIRIMDQYDPDKSVALVVDEWGTWWDVEPGTNPGFLYQQNTMRDALLAGVVLNDFNNRCDRIRMANIAQTVNVLQAMVLTDEEKMMVTPTYYVFEMYKVHQDATLLPLELDTDMVYAYGDKQIPALNASASSDETGKIHVSVVNIHPEEDAHVSIDVRGRKITGISGRILTHSALDAHNTFDKPDKVQPQAFNGAKIAKGEISMDIPAKSIVVLELD